MKNRTGWLFVVIFLFAFWAPAQYNFSFSSPRVCPSGVTQVGTFSLRASSPQTIPAGSTLTFTFDAPVAQAPAYTGPGTPTIGLSGNNLNLTFNQPQPMPLVTTR